MNPNAQRVLYLKGMHGLGDNFHQRLFIRRYLLSGQYDQVWLETSWVSVYWDLIEKYGLKVIVKDSNLRTQEKNAKREALLFCSDIAPQASHVVIRTDKQIWYRAKDIKETGSVLGAMSACLQESPGDYDFRLPLKQWWVKEFNTLSTGWNTRGKPILVYRPLVERTEWSGCPARNPLVDVYGELYASIRDKFFVVSIADVQQGKEWIVDRHGIKPDLTLHKGELPVEMLAVLVKQAAMTFCSPGFAVILSQAVGTSVACVFGGYENSQSFSAGARWAPYLGIDPINSCQCFQHTHTCRKEIDVPSALSRLQEFSDAAISNQIVSATPDLQAVF